MKANSYSAAAKKSPSQFKAHPWHGVSLGEKWPEEVTSFIEVVPNDTVKYELDKETGLLKVDRPQAFSNIYPTLYGMLPQTYCGRRIGELCTRHTGLGEIQGDGDPLDICVLTEKIVPHGDILLTARPIGGFRLIDAGKADDKIIAVLLDDAMHGYWNDLQDCPPGVLKRLEHFFLTYKQMPEGREKTCWLAGNYDKKEAFRVIKLAHEDYLEHFA